MSSSTKPTEFELLKKLSKDLRAASGLMSDQEIRFLVDSYYVLQDQRKRSASQVKSLGENREPHGVIDWYFENSRVLENNIKSALDCYSNSNPIAAWAKSIHGIGPVISSGFAAHIDCRKETAGQVWKFAGLDPMCRWEKGKKRPWNARLKTLCWHAGECFVRSKSSDKSVYGKMYDERKALESRNNEMLLYRDQAKEKLDRFKIGKDTIAFGKYVEGRLPDAHIHERCKRYVVKIFLSHYHCVGHYILTGKIPSKPWVVEHGGHSHIMLPPNMELVGGLEKACRESYGM